MPEMSLHLRSNVGRAAHGHHVHDLDVLHKRGALDQRFDERFGFGAARLDVNAHSRLDATQGFARRS